MANPSLQIGNGKWAIKEDNLLGYSTAGTRFVPEPITITRESAGTRVNSSGLVETVELLGSDGIEDGDFPSGTTEWTVSDGTVSFDNGATFDIDSKIYQLDALVTGKIYKATYEITDNVGGMTLRFYNGGAYFNADGSVGVHTVYFTALPSNTRFYINTQTGTSLVLKNISLKEVTRNNLARVDYDGTASSLLVEPMRTNEVTYSEDFSQWSGLIALSIGLNQGTSPSGLTDANLLSVGVDASATRHRLYNLFSFVSGDTYTFYMFTKKNEQDWFQLMFSSTAFDAQSYANFDLNNGVVGNTGTSTTANIIDYGNGWYKCSITCTATSSLSTTYEILTTNNTDSGRYPSYQSATAVNVCYLWGAQLEEGSYATSYIPTDGGTVTRVQDQYSKTGISNLINSEEGVLFVEIAALADDLTYRQISLSDGTSNNRIYLQYNAISNNIAAVVKVGGSTTAYTSTTLSSSNITDFNKIGFKWKLNDFALWINGVEVSIDTSGGVPTGLNEFTFNQTSSDFYGKVKQLQVFKTALTDPELATLTT